MAGTFEPDRHQFHNFSVSELTVDLISAIAAIRRIKPSMRFILTVSPVPLVATATPDHVLSATTYSKSALRVAAEEASRHCANVVYFPSYEMIVGPQAPHDYFEADRRNVSAQGVAAVMSAFLSNCEGAPRDETPSSPDIAAELSAQIVEAECEELMLGR